VIVKLEWSKKLSRIRNLLYGPGQSSMALAAEKVSGFSVQVSASLFLFPDT
jgi:hypothetical protein